MSYGADLGVLVRRLREARGLTQKTLAAQMDVSQAALSAWESGAGLPRREKLAELARALGVEHAELEAAAVAAAGGAQRKAEPETSGALAVERLHDQARAHVRVYGADAMSIWVLGANNLKVMRRPELLDRRWRENLLWGLDYNVVWVLDLLDDPTELATTLTTLAGLEEAAVRDWPDWAAQAGRLAESDSLNRRPPERCGVVNHYAVNGFDEPGRAMLTRYANAVAAAKALAAPDGPKRGTVHPYLSSLRADNRDCPRNDPGALSDAVKATLRCWQPETGIVLYRPHPHRPQVPAAANIRLMPVATEIISHSAPELEQPNYWFWLAPSGAARMVDAMTALEAAVGALEAEAAA
jgi:transcriptional regulator with XRE-family HTH domain